jgi:flagellar biosynthesis protein FlhF
LIYQERFQSQPAMKIQTFRAKTMQQALDLVRRELGPDAAVLHTRELNSGLLSRLVWGREYEIAASCEADVPSRFPAVSYEPSPAAVALVPGDMDYREKYRADFRAQMGKELDELPFRSAELNQRGSNSTVQHLPEALFQIYTDLIEADLEDHVAQAFIEYLRSNTTIDLTDRYAMRAELMQVVESELKVSGPIRPSSGEGRVVALVGPTGVGKTTTIAKLAANYRLRERKSVGLITVDTYRIAAVEQLRTYAEIIDLPIEVVSTPREMREAVTRMKSLDLVLMDTAGRSPRDEVRIQELKSILSEANPAEVHLVLSAVGSAKSLTNTAERFAAVGTTAMIATKLDEATGLGSLLSVARGCGLPVSYLTDGQNVPDDIQVAQSRALAQRILGLNQPPASNF